MKLFDLREMIGGTTRLLLACLGLLLGLTGGLFAQDTDTSTVFFVQVSDTHWGFSNPNINPDFAGTLKKGIAEINALQINPDFLIFTGDETHTTADPAVRRQRMAQFKEIISGLKVKNIKFIPGEHDAALDNAQAYKEFFGDTHYTFDIKGVHFVALDNVSTPDGSLGDAQLQWLAEVLNSFDKNSQLIVFAHRPLIDVYPAWDWQTRDAAQALALLKPFRNVKLFYGHIHQERVDSQDGFTQYAAPGMMFPLPAPGSVASPNPVAWDAAHPYRGLGFRTVSLDLKTYQATVKEYAITPDGMLPAD
jgi:3',5'-cyclic AMP phosphodiesterase CpdA